MNMAEVIQEVLNITARPDRLVEITSAINWAVSHCCTRSNFAYDLKESTITIDPASYGETLQFNNATPTPIVTRFRKFKYVKPTGVLRYLTPISSDKIFTPGFTTQRDVYYVGGNNITYILKELAPSLEIGYYQYPPILDSVTVNTFWLLDLAPWVIIDLASARIFKSIGDDASYKIYLSSGEEELKTARRDFEDGFLAAAK